MFEINLNLNLKFYLFNKYLFDPIMYNILKYITTIANLHFNNILK